MADRIEREIEEILAKLDQEGQSLPADRAPISIMSRRKRSPGSIGRARGALGNTLSSINPTTFLFVGAAMVVAGLVLSAFASPLIWVSFAGVLVFVGAFLMSFFRKSPAPGTAQAQRGVYWRDRYIEYDPPQPGPLDRLRKKFRRK